MSQLDHPLRFWSDLFNTTSLKTYLKIIRSQHNWDLLFSSNVRCDCYSLVASWHRLLVMSQGLRWSRCLLSPLINSIFIHWGVLWPGGWCVELVPIYWWIHKLNCFEKILHSLLCEQMSVDSLFELWRIAHQIYRLWNLSLLYEIQERIFLKL